MDIFLIIKDYAQTITALGVIAALLISFFSYISQGGTTITKDLWKCIR